MSGALHCRAVRFEVSIPDGAEAFDGRNWQANADLSHLSHEEEQA